MELTVLGCHAGMPTDGLASSGYLVSTEACRILLDCGPGVATALSARGGAGSLDAIVVSHLHPDHCFDLLPIGTTRLRQAGSAPLPLYVPRGARTLLDNLARTFPLRPESESGTPFHHAFAIVEYEPGAVFEVGDCALSLHDLRHAVPNCGTRVNNGTATMAYTGDTGPTEALLAWPTGPISYWPRRPWHSRTRATTATCRRARPAR